MADYEKLLTEDADLQDQINAIDARAIRYLYDRKLIEASKARLWGLVDEIHEPSNPKERVQSYAEELATKSTRLGGNSADRHARRRDEL